MPKPPLGPVKVGDRLLVIPIRYGRGTSEAVLAEVIKMGRVWVDLAEVADRPARTWRLRLDTQDSGSGYSNRDRFLSPEQYTWEQRQSAVYDYLREQRVMPGDESPWRSEKRMITLANLLRQHDGLDPL